ncbi:hypothetical protein TPDSL_17010 [Terrisporobacter petrolearius]|uniref:hypothetical protein n=1 Tax=Terrisporobacter petrolearius TaxID=1460447 RepID=UPI003367CD53
MNLLKNKGFSVFISNDGNIVLSNFNTNQELMHEFGYKPVVEIYPETTLDLEMLKIYEEKDDKIVVTYSVNNTERYLNSMREEKIYKSKDNLANYLAGHPLKSCIKGGIEKKYTVTQEKQNQLTSVITSYLNSALPYMMVNEPIPESIKIYWNSMGCVCEEWTYEEITHLKKEIDEYVRPLVSMQQHLEVVICGLPTQKEIKELSVEFNEENINLWLEHLNGQK